MCVWERERERINVWKHGSLGGASIKSSMTVSVIDFSAELSGRLGWLYMQQREEFNLCL